MSEGRYKKAHRVGTKITRIYFEMLRRQDNGNHNKKHQDY